MSKFWSAISNCPSPSDTTPWLRSVVIGAREVVPDEIWEVITTTVTQGFASAREERFYVLELTCEVIGRPTIVSMTPPKILPDAQCSLPIRVDWSDYINDRILTEAPGKRLLDRIQWAHYEEYQNGISRHFLTRTQREGKVGGLKRCVAEKYILASVVENRYALIHLRIINHHRRSRYLIASVSGQWKSVQEMAHETAVPVGVHKRPRIMMKMYLSA